MVLRGTRRARIDALQNLVVTGGFALERTVMREGEARVICWLCVDQGISPRA